MSANPINFDWTRGCVFVQDGNIYYSPNCSRPVVIPPQPTASSPVFSKKQKNITVDDFKQPVWWDASYGWLSFVPLSPSFTSLPFAEFAWSPVIQKETSYKPGESLAAVDRYQMDPNQLMNWRYYETKILDVAKTLRLWYGLQAALPPSPSSIGYDHKFYSKRKAVEVITRARDWVAVWMGYLSFVIAYAKKPAGYSHGMDPNPGMMVPPWYAKLLLLNDESIAPISENYLDGLLASTVSSFDASTPRAGVIFDWTESEHGRPDVKFFYDHNIPMYFRWSMRQENHILTYPALRYLTPPFDMITKALDPILDISDEKIDIPDLILAQYSRAPYIPQEVDNIFHLDQLNSPIGRYLMTKCPDSRYMIFKMRDNPDVAAKAVHEEYDKQMYAHHAAARQAASIPTQTMIRQREDEERETLFKCWSEFFEQRFQRQKEIQACETDGERMLREARMIQPDLQTSTVYMWKKIRTSGGLCLFTRQRIPAEKNLESITNFIRSQRVYNAMSNEWDLCHLFTVPLGYTDEALNDDEEINWGSSYDDEYMELDSSSVRLDEPIPQPPLHVTEMPLNTVLPHKLPALSMPRLSDSESSDSEYDDEEDYSDDEFDRYGYPRIKPQQPTPPAIVTTDQGFKATRDVLQTARYCYGFVPPPQPVHTFVPKAVGWPLVSQALGFAKDGADVNVSVEDRLALSCFAEHLAKTPNDVPADLFDLHPAHYSPLSQIFDFQCIHRPAENLYIFQGPPTQAVRWMLAVQTPSVVLYVVRLIVSNPAAYTLVTLANRLIRNGVPFRTLSHIRVNEPILTIDVPYEPASFRRHQYVFSVADYRTYMLQCEEWLESPRGRAALLRGGIISRIAREYISLDAALQGPSIEVMRHHRGYFAPSRTDGWMYCDDELSDQDTATICGAYTLYTQYPGQESVVSWWPPPIVWDHYRTGVRTLEWTERNETWYLGRLQEILEGKAKPMRLSDWMSKLHGHAFARKIMEESMKQATAYTNQHVPV